MGAIGPGGMITVDVTGVGGVPASDVAAVVLNTTVDQPTSASFLTVFPSDASSLPLASNLNFGARQTIPNLVIVQVGADGNVKVYNQQGSVQVIFDVQGWYGGTASSGTQPREDQVAMGAVGAANDPTWGFVPVNGAPSLGFDSGDYPLSSTFRLEVVIDLGEGQTTCIRLYDLTANSEVADSSQCATGAQPGPDRRRLRSGPLTLPLGEHNYTLQGESSGTIGGSTVIFSRIIVEWSE